MRRAAVTIEEINMPRRIEQIDPVRWGEGDLLWPIPTLANSYSGQYYFCHVYKLSLVIQLC